MGGGVTGADVLVRNLIAQGVRRVYLIPGAKIDRIVEVLRHTDEIELVLCRNEQSAAFMAAGHGRRTGRAGVVLVTSGPGVTNLTTALATANCEGDPVVALGGNAPISQRYKTTHQGLDNVEIMTPVTKFAEEIPCADAIAEVLTNAFRAAEMIGRQGAAFVSLPMDVMVGPATPRVLGQTLHPSGGAESDIRKAADAINVAAFPVMLCGMFASFAPTAMAIRRLLQKHAMPVVGTFQAAGTVGRELNCLFGGRVGLIHNTMADALLDQADLVVTVGYDPVEYDVDLWNKDCSDRKIVHIDHTAALLDNHYVPYVEVIGGITESIEQLTLLLKEKAIAEVTTGCRQLEEAHSDIVAAVAAHANDNNSPVHPLRIISDLQMLLSGPDGANYQLFSDMGSHHIFLARYLQVDEPRQISISNGQQTMGVSLPWAMSAAFDDRDPGSVIHRQWSKDQEALLPARTLSTSGGFPTGRHFISISGDGGFLFCAHELETAVRYGLRLVHIVFDDGEYNMVAIQQEKKYGHKYAVDLGHLNYVAFAEAFGAVGFHVKSGDEFLPTLQKALEVQGPVIIGVDIDYSQNHLLFKDSIEGRFH